MLPVDWLVRSLAFAFMALPMLSTWLQAITGDLRAAASAGRLGRLLIATFVLAPAKGAVVVFARGEG